MRKISNETINKISTEIGEFDVRVSSKSAFLRFGYWRRVDLDKLNSIAAPFLQFNEEFVHDEDCGNKYYYNIS